MSRQASKSCVSRQASKSHTWTKPIKYFILYQCSLHISSLNRPCFKIHEWQTDKIKTKWWSGSDTDRALSDLVTVWKTCSLTLNRIKNLPALYFRIKNLTVVFHFPLSAPPPTSQWPFSFKLKTFISASWQNEKSVELKLQHFLLKCSKLAEGGWEVGSPGPQMQ